jgi:hypothetical protein
MSSRTKYAVTVTLVATIIVIAAFVGVQNNSENTITSNNNFPVVSYNGTPAIDPTTYHLEVDGIVQHNLTFTLDQLKALPSVTETETLRCVAGPSGTANWTGVMLRALLDMAGLQPTSMKVAFLCVDNYSSDLTIDEARLSDVLVCYEMNGQPLPADQGFPIRIVVPDHWGYKWAKWVTNIEVVDYDYKGYWESNGWSDNAWITGPTDWYFHAILFSAAGVVGTLAAVSGVMNGRRRKRGDPYFLDPHLHTYVGYLFAVMVLVVFIWWCFQTEYYRGEIFYTLHGQVALASVLLETAGLITGVLLVRRWEKARWWHWFFSVTGFIFFLITIVLGIQLAIG